MPGIPARIHHNKRHCDIDKSGCHSAYTGCCLLEDRPDAQGRSHCFTYCTKKVVLGPAAAALFVAKSLAVPAAIDIPSVPSPIMLEMVTVRVAVPVPLTATVPLAVPVLFRIISAGARV